MDTDVQKSLVEFIQHITDNPEIVLTFRTQELAEFTPEWVHSSNVKKKNPFCLGASYNKLLLFDNEIYIKSISVFESTKKGGKQLLIIALCLPESWSSFLVAYFSLVTKNN